MLNYSLWYFVIKVRSHFAIPWGQSQFRPLFLKESGNGISVKNGNFKTKKNRNLTFLFNYFFYYMRCFSVIYYQTESAANVIPVSGSDELDVPSSKVPSKKIIKFSSFPSMARTSVLNLTT